MNDLEVHSLNIMSI